VIGHATSRSRAIVLRSGGTKRDVSILWVSCRDGLLCSCFGGTQNALFLSASSRSTKCAHTTALAEVLTRSGVSIETFRARMRLRADAANFAVYTDYGSTVWWSVLYRSVYSLVSFSSANVATCIAPGCRRLRGRCGHVKTAREEQLLEGFHNTRFGSAPDAVKARIAARKQPLAAPRAKVLNNEEEDEGIEKEATDTLRVPQDAVPTRVAARVRRNLLPCAGEVTQGEVWTRTADWQNMYQERAAESDPRQATDLKRMAALVSICKLNGMIRDVQQPLFEQSCGSCGVQRAERHKITKEPGLLTTHHPTANALKVCILLLSFSLLLFVGMFLLSGGVCIVFLSGRPSHQFMVPAAPRVLAFASSSLLGRFGSVDGSAMLPSVGASLSTTAMRTGSFRCDGETSTDGGFSSPGGCSTSSCPLLLLGARPTRRRHGTCRLMCCPLLSAGKIS